MKIAVVGAGGVGGLYGGLLARAGHEVAMLARGAHLAALRASGLEVTTPSETFTARVSASDAPRDLAGAELVLVTVKTYSLAEVAPAVRLVAEAGADVLPLLNGVEAAERLEAGGVPRGRLLGGLAEVSAARTGPGKIAWRSPFARAAVGELSGLPSPRVERIVATLREGGVEARASSDIAADLWRKLAFISAMAAGCGLSRASIGTVREARYGRLLFERAIREALEVAAARGVAVDRDGDPERILGFVDSLPAPMRPSFLLDLEAGGPNELEDLCGAISRLGRASGVPTPVQDTAVAALSAAAGNLSAARHSL